MRSVLIASAIVVVCVASLWLFGARQLILLLDQVSTARVQTLPADAFVYSPGEMQIGTFPGWTTTPDGQPADVSVDVDATGHLILRSGDKAFALGVRLHPQDASGRPDIAFAPDAGDEVTLTLDRSVLSWPTPFVTNFMSGQSPAWRRNLYYRLVWRKRSGAVLNMVWRSEQGFYASDGWHTGDAAVLVDIGISEGGHS